MDDNKDFLDSEKESEKTEISDTDTIENPQTDNENVTEETATDSTNSFADEFAETQPQAIDYNSSPAAQAQVANKKRVLQLPIIIAIILVVLCALGFLVFKCFFNTSAVGTWTVDNTASADQATSTSTNDEANLNYYTFSDQKDKDGNLTASISVGTMKMVGTYTVANADGKNTITINIPNVLTGSFEYSVTGNVFTGRTLTLTSTEYKTSVKLKSATLKTPELKPDQDFKPNSKITGKWKDQSSYNDKNSYNISYVFNEDGTMQVNEANQLYVDGVYTYNDKVITVTYYAGSKATMKLNYSLDGNTLVINGLGFSKDTGSSKDETK